MENKQILEKLNKAQNELIDIVNSIEETNILFPLVYAASLSIEEAIIKVNREIKSNKE